MRSLSKRSTLAGLIALLWIVLVAGQAAAVEDGLLGVRIGASYRELLERFGQPHGILFPSGGGLLFQTVSMAAPEGGLPQFGAQTQTTAQTPVWVFPVRTTALTGMQSQWVYDLRNSRGVALGILLSGEGADAVVTDVIVAGFPEYLKGKPDPVRTQKGIALQSSFSEVLKRYGYPPVIQIYAPTGISAAGPQAVPGIGGMRAGARMGGRAPAGGAMRAGGTGRGGRRGRDEDDPRGGMGGSAVAPMSSIRGNEVGGSGLQIVLTGARGGRGGMGRDEDDPRGGMGVGEMRDRTRGGGRATGARRGGLPPLTAGPAPRAAAGQLTATAIVEYQQINFSRDCVLVYEGIAFTLHDMKVFRIHVSE